MIRKRRIKKETKRTIIKNFQSLKFDQFNLCEIYV